MAYTPGTFSDSTMGDIIALENQLFATSRISELNTSIVSGQAILMNQDPNLQVLGSGNGIGQRCVSAKASAIRACDLDVEVATTQSCAVSTGAELGSEVLDMTKSNLVKIQFSVLDRDCHNAHSFAEKTAYASMVAKAKLEVALSKVLITRISSIADTPDADWFDSTPGTVNGDSYDVIQSDFGADLIADIRAASAITKMNSPLILTGQNLYNDTFLAQFKGVACCDNQSVLLNNPYQMYFDLHNVDSTVGARTTFAIDKNAILFWSAPDHATNTFADGSFVVGSPTPMLSDTYVWLDTLPRLTYMANGTMQPIYIDVRAKRLCEGSGVASVAYGWAYEYIVRGSLTTNLPNCDDRQGVLKFTRVEGA